MMNEPAFIALWFGSNKTGATASFLNTNLRQKSLLHCIDLSDIKVLVFGKDNVLLEVCLVYKCEASYILLIHQPVLE